MNMRHRIGATLVSGSLLVFSVARGTTVAYWDFETGLNGTPGNGQELLDNPAMDSISSYQLVADSAATGLNYTNQTIDGSSFCVYGTGSEAGFTFDAAFNSFGPQEWTIEASVRLDNLSGWRTVIGKDGYSAGADAALSDFYLQNSGLDNSWRLSFRTMSGETCVIDATGVNVVAGQWYGLAAVSDGTNAYLYVDSRDGTGYNLEATYAYTNAVVADNALASSTANWSFMRGWYNGGSTDYCQGVLDNVRFSDSALNPASFIPLPASPFNSITGSPVGSTFGSLTLKAVIIDGDSEFSSAVLSLDGTPVATNSTPAGATNTVTYVATGLVDGIHTGKVVVAGINPTISVTNEWTFEVIPEISPPATVSWNYNDFSDAYSIQSNDVSGVVPAAYWNDTYLDGRTVNLLDNTGAPSTVDISWESYNNYHILASHPGLDADGSRNREIINGYLNSGPAGWNPPITHSAVTLSQITYATYDIIVYFSSDVAGREGYVTDGSTTNYFNMLGSASINDGSGNALLIQTSDATTNGYTNAANYAVFSNLTGSAQTVKVQMRDIDEWGGIAAIQLVGKAPSAPTVDPVIQSISVNGGTVTLSWMAEDLGTYSIWRKTDLTTSGWSMVLTNLPSGNQTTNFPAAGAKEFYQIKGE